MLDQSDILVLLEEALQEDGEVTVPASGLSMGRRLARADGLVVRHATPDDVRFGSVVAFNVEGIRWVAHRVVWKFARDSEWLCMTKGDSNPGPDLPFVRKDELVGLIVGMRRGSRLIRLDRGAHRLGEVARGLVGLLSVVAYSTLRKFRR
jgi:signal peptidase I